MRDVVIVLLDLVVTMVRLARPGGYRSVVAESVLVKHQLRILNRGQKRAPHLRSADRIIAGLCTFFLHRARLLRSAIVLKPSTLLHLHHLLKKRKYRLLFSSGRERRKGIAKGMWQFIPETAVKYGLRIGPLADLPRADPADEREHFEAATDAATLYIKELYSTDAQASGLLVMACYNWGDDRVLPLVRSMPANPRDRNFWTFLEKYRNRIPLETYDYVFYIVSAAVIGEDPSSSRRGRIWC